MSCVLYLLLKKIFVFTEEADLQGEREIEIKILASASLLTAMAGAELM